MKRKRHIHDLGYKKLFSNPLILKDLLENFIALPFVKHIDFDTAEMLNTSFVDEKYINKESDVIYKLQTKNGKETYIYILLEFQSSVDKLMSFRMLRYLLEFYNYLLSQAKNKKSFPPVLPIMLYNGSKKWKVSTEFKDLIDFEPIFTGIEPYLPSFKYLKIAENEYSENNLSELKSVLSAIFLFENAEDKKAYERIIDKLDEFIGEDQKLELKSFVLWVKRYLEHFSTKEIIELSENKLPTNMEEAKSMFAETLEKVVEKEYLMGIERGIERGIEKGIEGDIIRAIEKGFDNNLINAFTDVSFEKIDLIRKRISDVEK